MTSSSNVGTLRAITNRLTYTAVENLPSQIGFLANSLSNCRDLLRTNDSTKNDLQLLVHKLKTRTSSLLQDRTPEGRLAGIILVRSLVEAGGRPFLTDSNGWIRGLISCLNKSDPFQVKQLAILAITKIYSLCVGDQTLVREIVTPTLPAYISASLSVIKPVSRTSASGVSKKVLSALLQPVLQSWCILVEQFASTVRPNVPSIKAVSLSLVSDCTCPVAVQKTAIDLLARLHYCAPKTSGATEWSQLCAQTIESAHDTADLVFRALIEDQVWTTSRISKITKKQKAASEPATQSKDVLGLDEWTGVTEGCSRICAQLDLLRALAVGPHSQAVILPIGKLIELASRLSSVTLPTARYTLRQNNEITRDEREELYLNLPRIHISLLQLSNDLCKVYGQHLLSILPVIAEQMSDIFEAEHHIDGIREVVYNLTQTVLSDSLYSPTKDDKGFVTQLTECVCNDLLPGSHNTKKDGNSTKSSQLTLSTDVESRKAVSIQTNTPLRTAAYDLLSTLLTHLPFHHFSSSVRTRLDQTAILIQHQQALLASILNPTRPRGNNNNTDVVSLLPFLARVDSDHGIPSLAKEALLRPRMPVLHVGNDAGMKYGGHDSDEISEQGEGDTEAVEMTTEADEAMKTQTTVDNIAEATTNPPSTMDSPAVDPHNPAKRAFAALLESTDVMASDIEQTNNSESRSNHRRENDQNDQNTNTKRARFYGNQSPSPLSTPPSSLNSAHQPLDTTIPAQSTPSPTSNLVGLTSILVDTSQRNSADDVSGAPIVVSDTSTLNSHNQSRADDGVLGATSDTARYTHENQPILDASMTRHESLDDGNGGHGSDSDDDEIPLINATLRTFSDDSDDNGED